MEIDRKSSLTPSPSMSPALPHKFVAFATETAGVLAPEHASRSRSRYLWRCRSSPSPPWHGAVFFGTAVNGPKVRDGPVVSPTSHPTWLSSNCSTLRFLQRVGVAVYSKHAQLCEIGDAVGLGELVHAGDASSSFLPRGATALQLPRLLS